jgi:formylglycine-generating enzyme required for sulfatase activity
MKYYSLRSGSWLSYTTVNCRPSYPNGYDPDLKDNDIGFRLIKTLK